MSVDSYGRAGWRSVLGERRDALRLALVVLLLAATFANPGVPGQRSELAAVVAIDITQSMNVVDRTLDGRRVSRLVQSKALLERALAQLPCGSALGWAIFTEYRSFLLLAPIEVCEHRRELLEALRRIDGRMAWAGNSEVAKALNSGLTIAHALPGKPALVFVSDGHEAPPVNPRYRPSFALGRGEVRGLVVGVGGDAALPIPKIDPSGQPLGDWRADEVLQIDPRSLGRGGSVGGEQMVEPEDLTVVPLPGVTPGTEHLSALREAYLQLLASETGLGYLRLDDARGLVAALRSDRLAQQVPARRDLRPLLAGAALLALLWPALAARWPFRRGRRAAAPAPARPQPRGA